jgi:hypothetical protein
MRSVAWLLVLAPGIARAGDPERTDTGDARHELQRVALAGDAFVPAPVLAPLGAYRGRVALAGGYDGEGPAFSTTAELVLAHRLALRAGFAGTDEAQAASATVQLAIARGVSVALGYEGPGFNTAPALRARVGYARDLGRLDLLATAGYSAGLEEGERAGELAIAGARAITPALQVGASAQGSIDLERDADEPADEPDWRVSATPFAALALGEVVVSARAGAEVMRYRRSDVTHAGVVTMLAVGKAF